MSANRSTASDYSSYLALDEVLAAQRPLTELPDEQMFVVAHQVHELWFKELLHEFAVLQRLLAGDATDAVVRTLDRVLRVMAAMYSPLDVLATLDPLQFHGFRPKLGTASGFQSAQFREIEAVLGRRDRRMVDYFPEGSQERARITQAMSRPSLFDALLSYLARQGYPVPAEVRERDVTQPLPSSAPLRRVLLRVYLDGGFPAQICERFLELDQVLRDWRYRHMSLAHRLLGGLPGTGGSAGVSYLRRTLAQPLFGDLWAIRSEL